MLMYKFSSEPWRYQGKNSWTFISLPLDISEEIRHHLKHEEEGWGRLKANIKVGASEWKTSIWYDTKLQTYVLPLNAQVRKKEHLMLGTIIDVLIWV